MNSRTSAWRNFLLMRKSVALLSIFLLAPGELRSRPQDTPAQSAPTQQQAPPAQKIPGDQLDALVAPIALYPDPLLAQVLAASTYPLELVQLSQWLPKNKDLKDKKLAEAVAKQPWDPSVQAMAGLPDVVKRLTDDIQWTTDLGNAFLAQQSDLMDAVQRMRKKAQDKGTLKTSEQQKVETKVVENKTVIVVEQAQPDVVYVPSYNPVVVYGAPVYAYPPIYYPPVGYYAAGMAVSFGVGVAMGAMWSGGWGYGAGWGHNDVDINVNNNFNRNANINRTNVQGGNRVNSGKWQHNSQHRGGAPYADRSTANRYGGTARGDSLSSRQTAARGQVERQGGSAQSSRSGSEGFDRSAGASDRAASPNTGGGSRDTSSFSSADRSGSRDTSSSSGSADRVGSRDMSSASSSGRSSSSNSSFGSGGYSGSSARASSSRGSSSFGGSRGGGRRR
jgi:hypothetical protein